MADATGKPMDLLRRFASSCGSGDSSAVTTAEDSGEVELCLGLSLGGCFERHRGLVRASSVTSFSGGREPPSPLPRTCSLPSEAEGEDARRRKEMQFLRRMEAKRKRSEKRGMRRAEDDREGRRWAIDSMIGDGAPKSPARRVAEWTAGVPAAVTYGGFGTHGHCCETKSLVKSGKLHISPTTEIIENTSGCVGDDSSRRLKETTVKADGSRDTTRTMLEQMPCVSTRGHGPEGKRIEGFLYKYGKEDEVQIVCVCHGSFMTPAEFVKHAGGGDVDHPLRHIVMIPPPSS